MTDSELEQKMKTMLEDTRKGMATMTELKTAVKEAVEEKVATEQAETKTELENAKSALQEMKKSHDGLISQINLLRRSRFAAIKTSDGRYNGVWDSHDQARNFGMFILACVRKIPTAKKYCEENGIEVKAVTGDPKEKAMGEDFPATGGVLVAPEFIPNLITLIESYGVFRRNAQEWPMASESGYAPVIDSDVTVYCPGFGTAPTASDPGFKQVGLQAQKWMTLTAIDSELTEDAAIAVGEIVGRSIARAFAKKEDECGFIGDGTATYFNRHGATPLLRAVDATVGNVAGLRVQATAGAWSAIVLADILALPGILPGYADDIDAKWFCNKNFYTTVMLALAIAAGGTAANEVVSTGYTRTPQFLGRQVEFTQAMPRVKAAADHCPVLLGNLRVGAYMGDRRKLTIAQSSEVYFKEDQLGIRGTERVAPTVFGVGNTTDPGPIVGLWADIT